MSPKTYLFFADSVLFIHVLVVAFVVLGLVVTLIGGVAKWAWARNPWFRLTHLACIGTVDKVYSGSFIAHWLDNILYYDLPVWVFTFAYSSFGALVLLSWVWVKPHSFIRKLKMPTS